MLQDKNSVHQGGDYEVGLGSRKERKKHLWRMYLSEGGPLYTHAFNQKLHNTVDATSEHLPRQHGDAKKALSSTTESQLRHDFLKF